MTASPHRRDALPLSFRLHAERIAARHRAAVGVSVTSRLETKALTATLGVPLVPLTEFATELPRATYRLYSEDPSAFSATAVCDETRPLAIVYNDGHEPERQRADIAHECAHLVLGHRPSAVFEAGRRIYPERLEAEASWLGPTLLVPRAGLLTILAEEPRLDRAAKHFHVSVPLVRYVYNTRGCSRIVPLVA
jgi:hypothetical protein